MRNWQRVKVMLSLLKSLNQSQASIDLSDDNEVEETKKSCFYSLNRSLSKMTVRPDTRYKLIWDMVANSSFLVGFFCSCIALGFRLPQMLPTVIQLDNILDLIALTDLLITSITQFEHEEVTVVNREKKETVSKLKLGSLLAQVSMPLLPKEWNTISTELAVEVLEALAEQHFPNEYCSNRVLMRNFEDTEKRGQVTFIELLEGAFDWAESVKILEGSQEEALPLQDYCKLEQKVYVSDFKTIVIRYLKSYLVWDFLACVPIIVAKIVFYINKQAWENDLAILGGKRWFVAVYSLKLLRYLQAARIQEQVHLLEIQFQKRFVTSRVLINNIFLVMSTSITLLVVMNLMTCLWIAMGMLDYGFIRQFMHEGLIGLDDEGHFTNDELRNIYFTSIYYVATTMTTVGYGDYYAPNANLVSAPREMIFVMALQFLGILVFSLVSNQVMSTEKVVNVEELISDKVDDLEMWLFNVDRQCEEKLPDDIYDSAIEFVKTSIRFSARELFHEYPYYKNLPPRLKAQVANQVMGNFYDVCRFFFKDYKTGTNAPYPFIRKMLTQLSCCIYLTGDKIIEVNKPVRNLTFFVKGNVNINGFDKVNGEPFRFLITRLPPGSWFGDYQLLTSSNSIFEIEAGYQKLKNRNINHIMAYQINSASFLRYCDEYPAFRKMILLRSSIRRAFFARLLREIREVLSLDQKFDDAKS